MLEGAGPSRPSHSASRNVLLQLNTLRQSTALSQCFYSLHVQPKLLLSSEDSAVPVHALSLVAARRARCFFGRMTNHRMSLRAHALSYRIPGQPVVCRRSSMCFGPNQRSSHPVHHCPRALLQALAGGTFPVDLKTCKIGGPVARPSLVLWRQEKWRNSRSNETYRNKVCNNYSTITVVARL